MSLKHILLLTASMLALGSFAQTQENQALDVWKKWGPRNKCQSGYIIRAGYTIGGTMPIPLPNEIRSINEFAPKGGATVGMDGYHTFCKRWGIQAGVHFFYQGFHTSADVKAYKMRLKMGENEMGGYFTGCDVTNTDMWGYNASVLATFAISPRWNICLGPFLSQYFKCSFYGEVYDNKDGIGYLRVDTPTGERVNMSRENPATYDFSDNMRTWNGGVELVVDWKATSCLNVFGMLDWGLANAFHSDFKETVPFNMYPVYATFGVAYRY